MYYMFTQEVQYVKYCKHPIQHIELLAKLAPTHISLLYNPKKLIISDYQLNQNSG